MARLRKLLLGAFLLFAALLIAFVVFIGPWPTYATTDFRQADYFDAALQAIGEGVARASLDADPGRLQAGWAVRDITPPAGTPMAGYSDRFNITPKNLVFGRHEGDKLSTGVRDPLHVKALALSDGTDTVIFVGADMLLVPPNVAEAVRAAVAAETPLTPHDIYFGASHTHCGPGAWGPGIASRVTGGKYDPDIVALLSERFASAIIEAYQGLEPARLGSGGVDAAAFIRNRARDAEIDTELGYLHVVQDDGDACFLVRFSAHPTIYGGGMLEFSAEYPGALQRTLARGTGAEVVYLGGALGSSGPRAPEAATPDARVQAMGEGLAGLILEEFRQGRLPDYTLTADIASVGFPMDMPPMQVRPASPKWRLSPLLRHVATIPADGWLQGARVGDVFFVGLPFDFSGEISLAWKDWAGGLGYGLWTTSFNSAYCGYLSPDRYYNQEPLGYETGFMSWFGPDGEALFTALFEQMFQAMTAQG